MTLDLVQITGAIGFAINAYSLTRKSDHLLRALIGVGFVVWSLNNWLLGAASAAALCLVAATRQGVAVLMAKNDSPRIRHFWFAIFMSAVYVFSYFTWKGAATVFACLSSTLSTIAMFYLSGARLRLTVAAAYALWTATTACAVAACSAKHPDLAGLGSVLSTCSGAVWGVAANIMLTVTAYVAYLKLRREAPSHPAAAATVPVGK